MEDEKLLKEEIEKIKSRNTRVELDKAWETSWTRRLFICLLTYLVVVVYSLTINKISNIWLSSVVPVIGFTLSTLSLKFIRKIWEKKIHKNIKREND
ncbi:MAG: hypothetical protein IJD48_03360 [Clostridia bacterium]|nr:hypothetical protein [Clostridia bacterium]